MTVAKVAPYGSWKSPISSEMLVADRVGLGQVSVDGDDIYWSESRPQERGRQTVMRRAADGSVQEFVPAPFNARTRVHEYGGAAFTASNGTLYFSNFADGRMYRLDRGDVTPRPITPEVNLRYADAVIDKTRNRLVCIREDHTVEGQEAVNTIIALDVNKDPTGGTVLVEGCNFYSSPRISPDGARLAWLQWNHPNMPWDGCEVWVGDFDAQGGVANRVKVAGGATEAVCQPEWSPDGTLYFIDEQTGWWNLYRWQDGKALPVHPMQAEFGVPHWVFGTSTYAFESADRMVCTYGQRGVWSIAVLDTGTGEMRELTTPFTDFEQVRAMPGYAVVVAGSPSDDAVLARIDLDSGAVEVLKRSGDLKIDKSYISVAQSIEFPTEGGRTAYGFYYAPRNPDFAAPEGEKPPLLVMSHGGPTSATSDTLSLRTQYWTSRGIAVLDVNYGGSTGYGREYRHRLDGQWGIVDVDDCINGALYLVRQGLADGDRLAIRGGSAGGFTTLNALTFHDVFHVGASYYGVADLEALAKDTHKFESRYGDSMVGPYPEQRDLYMERSAIHHTDQLSCPIIFFQGQDDMVVPPSQSRMMVGALRQKGLHVAYMEFEGEGHGFRQAANITRSIDAELYFYSKILGFELADPVEAVEIENMR
ncbi:MAG TPA: prolyl oligopeptidase family serine peptidase [Chloroflexia bacterium]|nr:prolyl oligopeptidase family serine peptidase [Chloroflexia bacterium]